MSKILLAPGQSVGEYVIETWLDEGSFGTFYRARHARTREVVALKILWPPSGVLIGRDVFALPTDVLLSLDYPGVLPIRGVRLDEEPRYVATAYAPGDSLAQKLVWPSPHAMKADVALPILSRIGAALSYLHQRGIVHWGVQPGAILFDESGHAWLSGLDLAIGVGQRPEISLYTFAYHAPEEEQKEISVQCDQYALGAVAYHLLTGKQPTGDMCRYLAQALLSGALSAPLGRAILRSLAELPSSRWPSVEEFLDALSAA